MMGARIGQDVSRLAVVPVGANHHSPVLAPDDSPPTRRGRPRGASRTLGSIVRGFKTGVTQWVRKNHGPEDIWQRNYYEHVIRDHDSLNRIRQYIANNPASWALDRYSPGKVDGRM